MSCLLLSLTVSFSDISAFFVFDELSTGRIFYRTFFYWSFADVFLMTRLGLWAFRRKITEIKCHFHHIISRVMVWSVTSIMICDCWCWVWSLGWNSWLGFPCVKSLLHCTLWNFLWKRVTMHNILLKSGNSCFLSSRVGYLHNLCGVPLLGRFACVPHLLIYSISYLYWKRLVDVYFIL